jgi:hypothetical protein
MFEQLIEDQEKLPPRDKNVQVSLGCEPGEDLRRFIEDTIKQSLKDHFGTGLTDIKNYVGEVVGSVAKQAVQARQLQQPTTSAVAGASGTTTPAEETSLEKNLRLLGEWHVVLPLRNKMSLCYLNSLLAGSTGTQLEPILVDFLVAVAEVLYINTWFVV